MSRGSELKERLILRGLLTEWYGGERAKVETVAYTRKVENVGELAEKMLDRLVSPEVLDGIRFQELWPEIAGKQIAAISSPISLRDGIAEIGVYHTAWMRELSGPIKKKLIQKINQKLGENHCSDIRFVPGARPSH